MKALKLTRSKTYNYEDAANSSNSPGTPYTRDVPLKASYEDLRSPDGRQVLRQHLNSQFPETSRPNTSHKISQESFNSYDMGPRDGLSRINTQSIGQDLNAKSSSSSVNSAVAKRLSTVRETNPQIDIEQAIHLLQELKKTASPNELVALHKALLPTRDSIIASPSLPVNDERSPVASASMIRHRSMLPPGLATRSASGDLLRTQEEAEAHKKLRNAEQNEWGTPRHQRSKSNLVALDLAADGSDQPPVRAATPTDHDYFHTGTYQPGTLRITNGAASPDPSLALRKAELEDADTMAGAERPASRSGYATAPTTPDGSIVDMEIQPFETYKYRQTIPRDGLISGIPVPLDRDESTPRIYKRSSWTTRKPRSQDPTDSPVSPPRDTSQSRLPLRVEKQTSRQSLNISRPPSKQSLYLSRTDFNVSRTSLGPLRQEIDDGRVSPLVENEVPRFAQRWSRRASDMSQRLSEEYTKECEISLGPYQDKAALLQRLSTVYDGEDAEATAFETPEAALSKLNGQSTKSVGEHWPLALDSGSSQDTLVPSQQAVNHDATRPMLPKKADSGYGTDSSYHNMLNRISNDAGRTENRHLNADGSLRQEAGSERELLDDQDVQSLYSLKQILKMPNLHEGTNSSGPSTPASGSNKKHTSLLRLSYAKRGATWSVTNTSDHPDTGETSDSSPVEAKGSPVETKGTKKKLQKKMPDSVRKERKALLKYEKEAKIAEDGNKIALHLYSTTPAFSRRISEPVPLSRTTGTSTPTTLHWDQPQTVAELPADTAVAETDATAPRRSSSRRRSKSRGRERKRSSTVVQKNEPQQSANESEGETKKRRSWSLGRNRSRTPAASRRSGSATPKRTSSDASSIPSLPGSGNEYVPAFTDYNSVSRVLGSSPYDQSTKLFRRSTAVPGAVMDQLRSPHQISTGLVRSHSGVLTGMDSGMASELGRMKSRDVAVQNNEQVYDRPRMATPKSSRREGTSSYFRPISSDGQTVGVNRPVLEKQTKEGDALSARPQSFYAESIPPLPEFPMDVSKKVSKIDGMAAKKLNKENATPSPIDSARNSHERPGDSTESIAEAVRRAVEMRKQQESKRRDGSKGRSPRPDELRKLRTINPENVEDVTVRREPQIMSPTDTSEQRVSTDWEQHAKMWRDRRKSLGEQLGKPVLQDNGAYPSSPVALPQSPAIVVSRYITPNSAQHEVRSNATRRFTDTAAEHASAYRDLIDDAENRPSQDDVPRTDSTATFVTTRSSYDLRPAKDDVPRTDSAYSTKSWQTAPQQIERARSPGGRVITSSGNYHPYSPISAEDAEQARLQSLQQLTGSSTPASRSTQSLDIPSRSSHDHKDTLESLIDRYGGGLGYDYEKGSGVGGSAGTRAKKGGGQRRSKKLSQDFGLDLSDVPIFLSKA